MGRFISTTHIVDKFKVVASIARVLLRKAALNGSIISAETHGKQTIFYPAVASDKPVADVTTAAPGKKTKGKK